MWKCTVCPKLAAIDACGGVGGAASLGSFDMVVRGPCGSGGDEHEMTSTHRNRAVARGRGDARRARRITKLSLLALALALGGHSVVAGCESRDPRPNVLLIVLDTTRTDFLSTYGFPKPTTPNIDEVAREGVRYDRALLAKIAELNLPIFLHGGGGRSDSSLKRLEDGGAGVSASALGDASVSEFVVRMIASGVFDRHPNLQVVIRSGGGGIPLLLNKLFWKHKGPSGEKRYSEILLEHFLVDTASVNARTLQFLMDTLGSERVVFGSDYCGGLGPLQKAMPVVDEQSDPNSIKSVLERNSRRLLHI